MYICVMGSSGAGGTSFVYTKIVEYQGEEGGIYSGKPSWVINRDDFANIFLRLLRAEFFLVVGGGDIV